MLLAKNNCICGQMANENIANNNKITNNTTQEEVNYADGVAGIETYDFSNLPDTKDKVEIKSVKKVKKSYNEEDLMLLAGIIQNEAGSDFCNDEMQKYVGSVVVNRVKSDYFPDSIEKVIFQKNPRQYDITDNFYSPTKRAIKNAKYVLENGSVLPSNCLFQGETKQGDGVYKTIKTIISTTYICYKN
jgi:spore germination cell wall hydrolase CwlJ-like protein